ncbi:MAG: hypothetical protein HZA51_18060 [Planctomycetes bacterium]|nr:hypothetical protein [Planctomycetota bacterium]
MAAGIRPAHSVHPDRWRVALTIYVVGGVCVGLVCRPLSMWAASSGIRPGVGTFLCVNALMPTLAVVAALYYPRARVATIGAFLSSVCLYLTMRLVQFLDIAQWTIRATIVDVEPVLVAATVGYIILAMITSVAIQPWRVVALPDAHLRCESCGYLLLGLSKPTCPECGSPCKTIPPIPDS